MRRKGKKRIVCALKGLPTAARARATARIGRVAVTRRTRADGRRARLALPVSRSGRYRVTLRVGGHRLGAARVSVR